MKNSFAKVAANANTVLSDLNELLVGFTLNNDKWFDTEAKAQHDLRLRQVTAEQYADAQGKAKIMAEEFVSWARKNKYSSKIKRVWWTARAGSMSAAYGKEVDQRKNPTDILVQFTSAPDNGFLGLSAKATKGRGDIGFKNPGLGTIEKSLDIDLSKIVDKKTNLAIQKLKLSNNTATRKQEIRKKPQIQRVTQELGQETLTDLRDALFNKLKKLSQKELFNYIVNDWMDSAETLPKYIKVTGMGNKEPYTASVTDPVKNEKMSAMIKGPIRLEKNGISSVLVKAGNKSIMKMRWKWESEPLASSMKASGDPA